MALHGGGGLAPGAELTLGLHGHRNLRVKVQAVDPYEVVVREVEGGAEERIHKLQIKYAYPSAEHKKVRKGLEYDKERRDRAVEPIARPQHRFACSDKRLGFAMEQKHAVTAVTLEGECFTGEIAWISRYEFAIRTRHGGEVVVFRHALDDLRDARAA
jgi:sRNA-binding regulator protein Hfq